MISILLKFNQAKNKTQLVKKYLKQQDLIKSDQPTNLVWINQEETSLKIKAVRDLIRQASYQSYDNQVQIYVLIDVDTASIPAQNALLKIIEEPPQNTQLILTATNPDRLLGTIKSRCHLQSFPATNHKVSAQNNQDLPDDLTQLVQDLKTPAKLKYSQIIDLAQQFKNRTQALALVKKLIKFCYNEKTDYLNRTQILKSLAQAYEQLEMNANVKLTLEHCFFKIKPGP